MKFILSLIALFCLLSTSNAQLGSCQSLVCRQGCLSYQWLCGRSNGCEWNTADDNCMTSDGINDNTCCLDVTTTTTERPTQQPTPEPTPTPTPCPDYSENANPCQYYSEYCCPTSSGLCQWSDSTICAAEGGPDCCEPVTSNPTESPTPEPTAAPTCPDYSGNANPCSLYSEGCCPTDGGLCQWSDSSICQSEGGPYCCELVTTESPTNEPTKSPTKKPSNDPSVSPTDLPSSEPTPSPTEEPTDEPTPSPTPEPTDEPTGEPTPSPTAEPTDEPTPSPTEEPTDKPTPSPTEEPTDEPTDSPTDEPTDKPTP